MDGFDKSLMVALLPTKREWSRLQLPHMTLVYAGEIEEVGQSVYNELCKAALTLSQLFRPVTAVVTNVDKFGTDDIVDVLIIERTPEILAMRAMLEEWDRGEHLFNPHTTIGPDGSIPGLRIPMDLTFDRVTVGYGDHYLTYSLWPNQIRPGVSDLTV